MKGKTLKTIEVFAVGSQVEFLDGGTKATVTQVCIQADNRISYEIAWWANNSRTTGWVSTVEIKPVKTTGQQLIGFIA